MSSTRVLVILSLMIVVVVLSMMSLSNGDGGQGQSENQIVLTASSASSIDAPIPTDADAPSSLLIVENQALKVIVNDTDPPVLYNIAPLTNDGYIDFGEGAQRLYIEVGTNDEPEMGGLVRDDVHARLIAFEPQPPVFAAMISKFKDRNRLIPIPAAVSPVEKFIPIHISEHRGCTSLLKMNQRASNFARKHKEKAPKKGIRIQLRTIEFCASESHTIDIPSVPLRKILSRVPMHVSIEILMTDAQGFDSVVLSTLTAAQSERVAFIITECQDLEPGHQLFLVNGAPSCHQQRLCLEKRFKHRIDFCWDNAPKVRELNCVYRHPVLAPPARKLPSKLKIVGGAKNVTYENSVPEYICP